MPRYIILILVKYYESVILFKEFSIIPPGPVLKINSFTLFYTLFLHHYVPSFHSALYINFSFIPYIYTVLYRFSTLFYTVFLTLFYTVFFTLFYTVFLPFFIPYFYTVIYCIFTRKIEYGSIITHLLKQ